MAYNFLIKRPYLNIYYKHTTIRDVFDFVISSIIPNDEQNPIIYDVMMMMMSSSRRLEFATSYLYN